MVYNNLPDSLVLSGASAKPVLNPGGVVSAATYLSGPVSPGAIVAIYGANLGLPACNGQGEEVLFNGVPAGIIYSSPTQINAQVPWEIAGAAITIAGAAASPGIFTATQNGTGQGAIVPVGTGAIATPDNPAHRGQYASIYGTGLGVVTNQPVTGDWSPWGPLAETTSLPVVTVGGVGAHVSWAGLAPDYVGLYQVNFIVHANAPTGSAVPVIVSVGSANSNAVTMAIQ